MKLILAALVAAFVVAAAGGVTASYHDLGVTASYHDLSYRGL